MKGSNFYFVLSFNKWTVTMQTVPTWVLFFNLVVSNVGFIDKLTSLSELDNRREQADKIRSDLNDLLKKDNLINKEERILLYNLYKKLKSEFEEIK